MAADETLCPACGATPGMRVSRRPLYCDAFRLHDQEGVPLTAQVSQAEAAGAEVSLVQFAWQAGEFTKKKPRK